MLAFGRTLIYVVEIEMYSFTLSRCGLSTCIKALIDWS